MRKIASEALQLGTALGRFCARSRSSHAIFGRCRDIGAQKSKAGFSFIRGDADFERHVDYTHFNPVKHGYVTRVCDWPYSSFHRYVKSDLLPADWGGDLAEIEGRFGE